MPERCFLAFELPGPVTRTLIRGRDAFRSLSPAWRDEKWVAPELLHVTLAFLGAVPDSDVPALLAALTGAAARRGPFCLRLSECRAVPSARKATMVWALLDGNVDAAAALQYDALAAASREPDRRPYCPHVTLVRARRPHRVHRDAIAAASAALEAAGKTPEGSVSVPSFTVFASTLGPTGPAYHPLARVPLSGPSNSNGAD